MRRLPLRGWWFWKKPLPLLVRPRGAANTSCADRFRRHGTALSDGLSSHPLLPRRFGARHIFSRFALRKRGCAETPQELREPQVPSNAVVTFFAPTTRNQNTADNPLENPFLFSATLGCF